MARRLGSQSLAVITGLLAQAVLGFRGLGFRGLGFGFRVQVLGFRVLRFLVVGFLFRVCLWVPERVCPMGVFGFPCEGFQNGFGGFGFRDWARVVGVQDLGG